MTRPAARAPRARAVAAPSKLRIALAVTLTAIVSLALLLAPRPGHAEFRAMENTRQSFHVIDRLLERP